MTRLLNFLWRVGRFTGREFVAQTGERVVVTDEGEQSDTAPGVWPAAVVTVDGERRRGSVVVGSQTPVPDGALLRVVESGDAPPVLGIDDGLVTQIVCEIPPAVRESHDMLVAGADSRACASRIAAMDSLRRTELMTALLVERLQRKTARIAAIFEAAECDWNQTFHTLLLQAMGGDRNREAFTSLAQKATGAMVSREKGSVMRLEALLLGAAGFLFAPPKSGEEFAHKDDYTLGLEEEARHLLAKYNITPLRLAVWDLTKLYPANHPVVRLAEIAALVGKRDFMLDGVLACRTADDVERLFTATAGEYWNTRHTPSGTASKSSPKTIGRTKTRLMAINLAAPLMFAYGRRERMEALCERALDLLACVPAEQNAKIDLWSANGCTPANAFESQALLQLGGEWCVGRECADCRLGRVVIKKALEREKVAIFA